MPAAAESPSSYSNPPPPHHTPVAHPHLRSASPGVKSNVSDDVSLPMTTCGVQTIVASTPDDPISSHSSESSQGKGLRIIDETNLMERLTEVQRRVAKGASPQIDTDSHTCVKARLLEATTTLIEILGQDNLEAKRMAVVKGCLEVLPPTEIGVKSPEVSSKLDCVLHRVKEAKDIWSHLTQATTQAAAHTGAVTQSTHTASLELAEYLCRRLGDVMSHLHPALEPPLIHQPSVTHTPSMSPRPTHPFSANPLWAKPVKALLIPAGRQTHKVLTRQDQVTKGFNKVSKTNPFPSQFSRESPIHTPQRDAIFINTHTHTHPHTQKPDRNITLNEDGHIEITSRGPPATPTKHSPVSESTPKRATNKLPPELLKPFEPQLWQLEDRIKELQKPIDPTPSSMASSTFTTPANIDKEELVAKVEKEVLNMIGPISDEIQGALNPDQGEQKIQAQGTQGAQQVVTHEEVTHPPAHDTPSETQVLLPRGSLTHPGPLRTPVTHPNLPPLTQSRNSLDPSPRQNKSSLPPSLTDTHVSHNTLPPVPHPFRSLELAKVPPVEDIKPVWLLVCDIENPNLIKLPTDVVKKAEAKSALKVSANNRMCLRESARRIHTIIRSHDKTPTPLTRSTQPPAKRAPSPRPSRSTTGQHRPSTRSTSVHTPSTRPTTRPGRSPELPPKAPSVMSCNRHRFNSPGPRSMQPILTSSSLSDTGSRKMRSSTPSCRQLPVRTTKAAELRKKMNEKRIEYQQVVRTFGLYSTQALSMKQEIESKSTLGCKRLESWD
eukprot:Blabericola_migrator_1__3729@NODE_2116_length_3247_cov_52_275157_g1341_i0_p1_GENE_NODE_2116_length_3247_cov_52_275157_g1341_i0NODE_2116_length_3247_cov_52_275157_g1341_i0_p1_ORF_typecomplete_len776_score180_77_NODE_2116_length_3247_cov_52_275157_g1341_i02662593